MFADIFFAPDFNVILHCENGLLGIGPFPHHGEENADLINAGEKTHSGTFTHTHSDLICVFREGDHHDCEGFVVLSQRRVLRDGERATH